MDNLMNVNIMLLGGARRVTLLEQIKRIGNDHGIYIDFISVEKDEGFYPISSYARVIAGPKFNTEEFSIFLKKQLSELANTIIVPCMDAAIPPLAKIAEESFSDRIVAPTSLGAEIALDKSLTSNFCEKYSIPHPQKFSINSKFMRKVIAKPKQGFGGKGIAIFETLSQVPSTLFESHIVQEYINGQETTHDVYMLDDGSFFSASRTRLAVIDGEVDHCIVRESTESELALFDVISRTNLFRGPITIQTINCDGKDYLIEINARLGGGVTASIEAGYPVVELILEKFLHIEITKRQFRPLEMKRARRDFYRIID